MLSLGVVSKKVKTISTIDLLKKYDLFDSKIEGLIWHLNIENLPVGEIRRVCRFDEEINEDETARLLHCAISACEMGTEGFNEDLYYKFLSTGIRYKEQKKHSTYGVPSKRYTDFPGDETSYGFMLDQLYDGCVFDVDTTPKVFMK